MNPFQGLYTFFITRSGGKIFLLIINLIALFGTMVLTAYLRQTFYGSLDMGIDLLTGFLLGFTLLVSINTLVYIGSLSEKPS